MFYVHKGKNETIEKYNLKPLKFLWEDGLAVAEEI